MSGSSATTPPDAPEPRFAPVVFARPSTVDGAALIEEANILMQRATIVVGRVYPEVDLVTLHALARSLLGRIADPNASTGVTMSGSCLAESKALARKKVLTKPLTEASLLQSYGPAFEQASELMARALPSLGPEKGKPTEHRFDYERFESVPTDTNPTFLDGLGVDRDAQTAPSMRFWIKAAGAHDRVNWLQSLINTRGTCHDWSCEERYSAQKTARFAKDCGRQIAGPILEHLDITLRQSTAILRRIQAAGQEGRLTLETQAALEGLFPRRVILDGQKCGPSPTRGVWYSFVEYPGDDPAVMTRLAADGKSGIARCSSETLDDAYVSKNWRTPNLKNDPLAERYGVQLHEPAMHFRHFPDENLLVRHIVGGMSEESECWRIIPGTEDLAEAAALILIAKSSLFTGCVERARIAHALGKISIKRVETNALLRCGLHVADDALVTATRWRS
jgi:hypothetical protein